MTELILTWWPVVLVIVNGLGLWVAWSMRKQFVTHEQFERFKAGHAGEHESLDARLADGDKTFTALKGEIEHLPSRREIEETIAQALTPLQVSIEAVKEATDGIRDNFQVLLSHELAEARDAKAKAGI